MDKYNVKLSLDTEVRHISKQQDKLVLTSSKANTVINEEFENVVICAGVGTQAFADKLGDKMNVYPVKGYSITINLDDEISKNAAPYVSLIDQPVKIVASRLGDRFRLLERQNLPVLIQISDRIE